MRISDWSSDVCSSDLPGLGAVAVQPTGEAEHGGRRRADLVGGAAGEVVPEGYVGGVVLPAHVLPDRVAGTDRLQGDEHPCAVDVGEPVAAGVELLDAVHGPLPPPGGAAVRGRRPGPGPQPGDPLPVADHGTNPEGPPC